MSGTHFQQPEGPCRYHPEITMKRSGEGTQCPVCAHRIWDIHENKAESGYENPSKKCTCANCNK